MYQINLNNTALFQAKGTQTLLEAARLAEQSWPYSCQTGRCSACKCKVLSGQTMALAPEAGLTDHEKAEGWVLACMRYLAAHPGPSYLRLGKAGEPNFHSQVPSVEPGQWLSVRRGDHDRAILSTGAAMQIAMDWLAQPQYVGCDLYSMPLWSMSTKAVQCERLRQFSEVMTIEDHLLDGGFGSWMLEAKSMTTGSTCRVRPVALSSDVCGMVGSQQTLNQLGGLLP